MEDKISIIKADKGLYKEGESIDVGGSIFYIIGFTKDNDIKAMLPEYYEGSSYQLEFMKKTVVEDEERYQKLCDENEELENANDQLQGLYNVMLEKYNFLFGNNPQSFKITEPSINYEEKYNKLVDKYSELAEKYTEIAFNDSDKAKFKDGFNLSHPDIERMKKLNATAFNNVCGYIDKRIEELRNELIPPVR